jgi:hypothetical protein
VTAQCELIGQSAMQYGWSWRLSCSSYVLDGLCNKFWQNMYLRHFLLTWVQNGPVVFGKNLSHVQNNVCAKW